MMRTKATEVLLRQVGFKFDAALGCALICVNGIVTLGCSCSVETSNDERNEDASTRDDNTREAGATNSSKDASATTSGNTGELDVTLERPEAGSVDVTLDDQDGGHEAGTIDASPDATAPDAQAVSEAGLDAEATNPVCTSVFATCVDGAILVCSAVGEPQETFTCPNGCDVETNTCLPLQLNEGWFVHQFELADDSSQVLANYIFESDGLVAIQTANPLPSAYLRDAVFESFIARGKISVTTSSDDDMFGFVFGWQDPQHFYLVDWKQSAQDDATCGLAPAGFALKLVNSETPLEACQDFWAGTGSDKVTPLVAPTAPGWAENVVYDFELEFRPGDIHLTIREADVVVVELESSDTTYTSGLFGFYNYSQEGVRYEFFTIEPAP